MSAGIIIGVLAFLGFLEFIGYSIYNITSNTICDSSKCISPGGTWIKDKCTCSCNPGYSGVNCQTKSKHVSDLETACKDKTGKDCVSCLNTNISQKLKGNPSDVQQFTDDFTSSISAINNICCSKNCSNTSGTACDNCVSEKMNNLNNKLNTSDKTYEINDMGCLSIVNELQKQANYIGKTTICSDSGTTPSANIPQCQLTAGQVKKCSDVNKNSVLDFSKRYQMCDKLLSDEKEICTVNPQKTSCISTKKKCIHPNNTDGKLYGSDKCNFNGFYDSNKCQCPGMTNQYGWVGRGGSDISWYQPQGWRDLQAPILFYADDNSKCKTTCKQQGNNNEKLAKGCPCADFSPDCHNNTSCKPGSDHDPHRKCS